MFGSFSSDVRISELTEKPPTSAAPLFCRCSSQLDLNFREFTSRMSLHFLYFCISLCKNLAPRHNLKETCQLDNWSLFIRWVGRVGDV